MVVGVIVALTSAVPSRADFRSAQVHFNQLPERQQVTITLALIATGDFDGLVDFGFTKRLYTAVRRFESRYGLAANGVLEDWELHKLRAAARPFFSRLGSVYYPHPTGYSRLLVPRGLFDHEQRSPREVLFTRTDQNLSLNYTVFPKRERSFEELYATMTKDSAMRRVTYTRRFHSHFVVTGTFRGKKFYTWVNRLPKASVGFTVSWSNAWDTMGRKISALLANSLLITPASAGQL
jgi:serine protease Do